MLQRRDTRRWLAGIAVVALGCSSPARPAAPVSSEGDRGDEIACTEPRPEICTREYRPVCARVDNGIRCVKAPCPSTDRRTYSNGCTACSDPKVYGYRPGACEDKPPGD